MSSGDDKALRRASGSNRNPVDEARWRRADDLMNTPQRALRVSRMAAWGAYAVAGGLLTDLVRLAMQFDIPRLASLQACWIEALASIVALGLGALAYLRPAVWTITLALGVVLIDGLTQLTFHGFSLNLGIDVFLAILGVNAFRGLRRYRQLVAAERAGSAFA